MWDGGLTVTGGALEPSKSFWYLVDYTWDNGKWRYKTIQEAPGELYCKADKRIESTLKRLKVYELRRTLGV
jgi:hypothetical protein